MYKNNIETFPDLIIICAVHSDTSRQFVASVFGKQLIVRIDSTFFQHKIEGIFLDLICAVHLLMSRQFVASVFGIQFGVGINGNIYSSNP